jgi:hypothetical protein
MYFPEETPKKSDRDEIIEILDQSNSWDPDMKQ